MRTASFLVGLLARQFAQAAPQGKGTNAIADHQSGTAPTSTDTTSGTTSSTYEPGTLILTLPPETTSTAPASKSRVTRPSSSTVTTFPRTRTVVVTVRPKASSTRLTTKSVRVSATPKASTSHAVPTTGCAGCTRPEPTPATPDDVNRALKEMHVSEILDHWDLNRYIPTTDKATMDNAKLRKDLMHGLSLARQLGLPSKSFLSWVERRLIDPMIWPKVRYAVEDHQATKIDHWMEMSPDNVKNALKGYTQAAQDLWAQPWEESWLNHISSGKPPVLGGPAFGDKVGEEMLASGQLSVAGAWWGALGSLISGAAQELNMAIPPQPPMVGHYGQGTGKEDQAHPPISWICLYDYKAADADEISFSRSETIQVIATYPSGWAKGTDAHGKTGFFPSVYARPGHAGDVVTKVQGSWTLVPLSPTRATIPSPRATTAKLPGEDESEEARRKALKEEIDRIKEKERREQEEEMKRKQEEEVKRKQEEEEEKRRQEEERIRQEEEIVRKQEEERRKQEEEERRKQAEEKRRLEEEERRKQEEEKRKEEEEERREEEEERKEEEEERKKEEEKHKQEEANDRASASSHCFYIDNGHYFVSIGDWGYEPGKGYCGKGLLDNLRAGNHWIENWGCKHQGPHRSGSLSKFRVKNLFMSTHDFHGHVEWAIRQATGGQIDITCDPA